MTLTIDGEAEEVSPLASPPAEPPAPLAMPPVVEAGIMRASQEATVHGGTLRVTRRVPETDEWFIVLERQSGGYAVIGWTGEGEATQRGPLLETMADAHHHIETLATGAPPPVPGQEGPLPKTLLDDDPAARLAWAKERAKEKIDQDAERCRLKFITGGAGQAMEYLASEQEADQVLAAGPDFVLPDDPTLFPFLRAEANVRGTTVYEAAQVTAQAASLWRQVGAAIKALRLGGKAAVDVAETEEEVWAASKIAWPEPD